MQEKYGEQVVAISWNLDHDDAETAPSEELQKSVLAQLQRLNLTTQNLIASDSIDDVLSHYDVYGLPATLVFGSDGQLAKAFMGAFTYEKDIVPFVQELLDREGTQSR